MKAFKQRMIATKLEQEISISGGIISVDVSSCDGCGVCAKVCPQSAIRIITLANEEIKNLSFKGRLKVKIKGKDKATINNDLCTACGLCMKQCHEFAIHKKL